MYVYFNSVVHYTSYANNVRQIKQIQTHPESRPTSESLKDCGWVISNSGWPKYWPRSGNFDHLPLLFLGLGGVLSYNIQYRHPRECARHQRPFRIQDLLSVKGGCHLYPKKNGDSLRVGHVRASGFDDVINNCSSVHRH